MKQRTLLALLSFAVLCFPAFAQQSTSNSASQPAASSSQNSDVREPLKDEKPANFWDGDDPNVVNLVTHPFARKAWIKRQIAPISDRINELDEITSENATKIKDIDARSQKGLQLASEKATLADQHATEASTKAQTAQTSATQASTHVSNVEQMVGNLDQYKSDSQTEIRFRPGQTVLSKTAKDALDQMAGPLKDQHSYIFEIRGFAPGRGTTAIAASQKMADSVVRYLVESQQIPVYRIFVIGMGNSTDSGEQAGATRSKGARVEVNVLKNDLTAQR
ncbi:MAG TPA: OmpA family protein [Candidatus Sulfotelmatobacter sp.]|nr:OmpA family protein [Candidatus Sulfotelmatobacter sp.]